MDVGITREELTGLGMGEDEARALLEGVERLPGGSSLGEAWSALSRPLLTPDVPFAVHLAFYRRVFAGWDEGVGPRPAWTPTGEEIAATNIDALCRSRGLSGYDELYRWSIDDRAGFWKAVVAALGTRFRTPPDDIVDLSAGIESPRWLPGARMNAVDSCFLAPGGETALVYQDEGGPIRRLTFDELNRYTNRVANSLGAAGLSAGDAVAIAMPMTLEAVAAYIGIVKAGCIVVSIADSFSAHEIETRLRISGARGVVTQDVVLRGGKTLPMYEKVVAAGAGKVVVTPAGDGLSLALRDGDLSWDEFLVDDDRFEPLACDPGNTFNVLFSSGTTGDPKAIPWSHSTALKCAMDGYFHHDVHPGDVVAWPTNIGWMMGPWLIFASLMNRASMALYYGAPNTRGFCEFVQDAGVTMLGVVPSLVKTWRSRDLVDGLDWSAIRCYSSTGEASNWEDMLWLMSRAGYKPVVEYCGGTEIGGGYVTQALVQPASPSTFSTPSLGLAFYILDEDARPTTNGELFLVPPSIGLSVRLLNRDHHEVYYEGTPTGPRGELLRRHGDQMEWLPGGYVRCQGRADDTMNLGGIKVSSAEIERVANRVDGVLETAAIAVDPKDGGPSQLVLYVVAKPGEKLERNPLKAALQKAISGELNPLFRVHDVSVIEALPRTASNKVMRRVLRDEYAG